MAMRMSKRNEERTQAKGHKKKQLELAISSAVSAVDQSGFEVKYINADIGYGVFTKKDFSRGDYLLEYRGELVSFREARKRELHYEQNLGSFLFYFKFDGKCLCVDATYRTLDIGRMINDAAPSDSMQNSEIKVIVVEQKPHLCLFAARDIQSGEELRYDYGVETLPWRKKANQESAKLCDKKQLQKSVEDQDDAVDSAYVDIEDTKNPNCHHNEVVAVVGDNHDECVKEDTDNSVDSVDVDIDETNKTNYDHNGVDAVVGDNNDDKDDEEYIASNEECRKDVKDSVDVDIDETNKTNYDHNDVDAVVGDNNDDIDDEEYIASKEGARYSQRSGLKCNTETFRRDAVGALNDTFSSSEDNDDDLDETYAPFDSASDTDSASDENESIPVGSCNIPEVKEQAEVEEEERANDNASPSLSSDGKFYNHNEESVAFKKQMRNVTIPTYSMKENGERNYRKVNHCLFCHRAFVSKISDHYLNIHHTEDKVRAARMLPMGSEERRKILLELENRGNFRHNVKTIEKGEGELVLARRPNAKHQEKYSADKFLPCEYCLAFYLKDSLWSHMASCKFRPLKQQPSNNYVRNAYVMLTPFIQEITEEDAKVESLLNGMKETYANPGIPSICKKDTLIREFAKSLLCRLGEEDEQRVKDLDNIRTKVRTVGRLLNELNSDREENLDLLQYISPKHFFKVINATKSLALKSDSPQIALVLGHYVKHVVLLKTSLGILNDCAVQQNEGRDFQLLYEAHWNNQVSCVAKRRQKLRQLNKKAGIPLTDDLVSLKDWLRKELTRRIMIDHPDDTTWKLTAQLSIARIVLFNKRRISEVEEFKVLDFLSVDAQDDCDAEIFNSLDVSEKILSKRMKVVEVRGKSTRAIRKVYILLTPDMVEALDYLMRTRYSNSPFLFCRKTDNTPLDGCEAMRIVTQMCPGLIYPERIRTRKLRKYLATTSQIIDMKDSELKILADHMGHNLNVHTDVYRLQSSLLEKTKVARVLIAMENGYVDKFNGKSIQAISIEGIPEPISHNDTWTATVDADDIDAGDIDNNTHDTLESMQKGDDSESEQTVTNKKRLLSDEKQYSDHNGSDADTGESVDGMHKRQKASRSEKIKRMRWSENENMLFREKMQSFITSKAMPPSYLVHDLAQTLHGRTPAQIRTKIHNIISGKLKRF